MRVTLQPPDLWGDIKAPLGKDEKGKVPVIPVEDDWLETPVRFTEFCESKEHMNLLPHNWKPGEEGALSNKQYYDCLQLLGDDPKNMFNPDFRKFTFAGLCWGKGCLEFNTEIKDETDGKIYTIGQLYKEQKKIKVLSYDRGKRKPVVKEVTEIHNKGFSNGYKFTFWHGCSKTVGENHLFYLEDFSQICAKDLKEGQTIQRVIPWLSTSSILCFRPIKVVHIEKVEPFEVYDITVPDTECYFDADGVLHHNSGKDFICSIIQAYLVYILLCMRSPRDFFGFAMGEPCDIINVAKKGKQAKQVYFQKFKARILHWKWLKVRYNIVDEGRRYHFISNKHPLCKIGSDAVEFKDKNVRAFSEASEPEGFEGYNIVFYLCDEISGWVTPAERTVARKMLTILRSSQGSRKTKTLVGLGMAISYPRQDDDIMFEFREEAKLPGSKVYWSEAVPWDVRPKRLYCGKTFDFVDKEEIIKIPVELKDDFDRDPESSKAQYLLRPQAVFGQLFEYQERIDDLIHKDRQPLFKIETEVVPSTDGQGNPLFYLRKYIVGKIRDPDQGADYVVWLDAAESGCDASLSIGHQEIVTIVEAGKPRQIAVGVVDQTVVWEPDHKKRLIVDIGSMTAMCIAMKRYLTIGAAWYDEWNSGTGVHDLRMQNISCDRHNLDSEDYNYFKSIIYTGRFLTPDGPDYIKGVQQVKHLARNSSGKVVPGSQSHKKDIADTWCGIVTLLLGNLAGKVFRAGTARGGITLGGGKTAGVTGSGAFQRASENPFAGVTGAAGAQLVKNPADMFREIMGRGAKANLGSGKVKPGGGQRFPAGIRL
jgi:hypothetical protein